MLTSFGENISSAGRRVFQAERHWPALFITLVFLVVLLTIVQLPNFGLAQDFTRTINENYLPIHVLLEFIGILVSFGICTVGLATYQNARSNDILILSIAGFATGLLDFGHTLAFTGMPDFLGTNNPDKAIMFWLASRVTGSTCFLYVALSRPRETRVAHLQNILFAAAVLWCAFWFWIVLFHLELLPPMFVQGIGLQPTKIWLEWFGVAVSGLASLIFFSKAQKSPSLSFGWMGCACGIYAMGGYFFTVYREFNDLNNFFGHIYKSVAFIFLYRAVFIECISKPYENVARLAEEASFANASKSRFLANVSHEFRTPLGIMNGFADLILATKNLDPTIKQWAMMIERNARQLNLLIDDLLDLAKAESDKISLNWSRFNLTSVLEELVLNFSVGLNLKSDEKRVEIQLEVDISEPHVVSDELRFRQIITNILGNALKFTTDGTVKITAHRETPVQINISIEDSGVGISDEDAAKLFQPFVQADSPHRRRFGGTGLGLAISRKLAHLLGGDIVLAESRIGFGSTFLVTIEDSISQLPIETSAPRVRKEGAGIAPDFSGARILVAEDSPDNQTLLRHYLLPTNVQVVFANQGLEAKTLALSEQFDLILMDIQMPVMDGFEATAALRKSGWAGPILAFTAHALQPERARAMAGGFNDYLVKPIAKPALWQALERHLLKQD